MTNDAYYKSNDIIQIHGQVLRRDPLSEGQRKIIAIVAAKVDIDDTADTTYTMTVSEIIKTNGLQKNGKLYDRIFNEIYELRSKTIALIGADSEIFIESYMDKIKIDRKTALVTYHIPETILPHFKGNFPFTRLDLLEYLPIRGQYALMLYELLASRREDEVIYYTLEDLRRLLEVPEGAYPKSADFLRHVIYLTIGQINKRTQGSIEYKLKYGYRRKIEGVTFFIPNGKEPQPGKFYEREMEDPGPMTISNDLNEQAADILPRPSSDLSSVLTELIALIKNKEQATALFEAHGDKYCDANIKYINSLDFTKTKPENIIPYKRGAIAKNYAQYKSK